MEVHHANILSGGSEAKDAVFKILEEDLGFKVQANPDFYIAQSLTLGIEEARRLKRWAAGKALLGERKVYLAIAGSITEEAQNAMLKVLEEPTRGTYIFIILSNLSNLLPTLLSRVRVLRLKEKEKSEAKAEKFLNSKLGERLALVQNMHRKEEGKEIMKNLISGLEKKVYNNDADRKKSKAVLVAKILVEARGSSPRMLLEWLSGVI